MKETKKEWPMFLTTQANFPVFLGSFQFFSILKRTNSLHKFAVCFFLSSLPELTEMKRLLDMHTNIATALLDQIKVRNLQFRILIV